MDAITIRGKRDPRLSRVLFFHRSCLRAEYWMATLYIRHPRSGPRNAERQLTQARLLKALNGSSAHEQRQCSRALQEQTMADTRQLAVAIKGRWGGGTPWYGEGHLAQASCKLCGGSVYHWCIARQLPAVKIRLAASPQARPVFAFKQHRRYHLDARMQSNRECP